MPNNLFIPPPPPNIIRYDNQRSYVGAPAIRPNTQVAQSPPRLLSSYPNQPIQPIANQRMISTQFPAARINPNQVNSGQFFPRAPQPNPIVSQYPAPYPSTTKPANITTSMPIVRVPNQAIPPQIPVQAAPQPIIKVMPNHNQQVHMVGSNQPSTFVTMNGNTLIGKGA